MCRLRGPAAAQSARSPRSAVCAPEPAAAGGTVIGGGGLRMGTGSWWSGCCSGAALALRGAGEADGCRAAVSQMLVRGASGGGCRLLKWGPEHSAPRAAALWSAASGNGASTSPPTPAGGAATEAP
eukprot:CAMPEP_0185184932 /NCGR_PEP_ID=MMETSP1140-20130426/2855_1 /TAXON_ID=298111 /ORGANISM="Pavlova sp., Strain CCMP459" /LENGTH=125 /DNA_ID=CAMNT_0027751023 /DNA_START=286 /DNA_END=659 /DNA_ORIENTATION=-